MLKRILLVLTVAMVRAAMMALGGGPAFAQVGDEASCQAEFTANPSGGGVAEPGGTGGRARYYAEENKKSFGAATSEYAQREGEGGCGGFAPGPGGPPRPFDPKAT